MPYIKHERRSQVLATSDHDPIVAGELNYQITMLLHRYLDDNGTDYQHFNDCIGVLECAKLELYRRFVAPYEDKKIKDNGDVP